MPATTRYTHYFRSRGSPSAQDRRWTTLPQTRRHGVAYRGRAPPNDCLCPPKRKLCPPKRGLCPEEINRLGATGVQIEVQIGVCHRYFCSFCGLTPDFMTFLGWRPFFFGDHLFSAGKTAWIPDFGRKIPLNLCSSPCLFDPDWDKFLVPPCPSRIHINKLLVPPKNLFLPPPSHAILAPGLHCHQSSVLKQTF